MNVFRFLLTVGGVLLSTSVQRSDATSCDLMTIFSLVKPLETNADVVACIAKTGYEMLPPSGPPSDEQLEKVCGATSCISVFNTLQKMSIPDCTIDILGGLNIKQVFDGVAAKCSSGTKSSSGSSGDNSSSAYAATSTPAPAATPTVTPAVKAAKSTTQTSQPLAAATPAPAPVAKATAAPATAKPPAASSGVATASEPTLEPKLCV